MNTEVIRYNQYCMDFDHIVIFQTKMFGYELNESDCSSGKIDFLTLYSDLCRNKLFCEWIRGLVPAEVTAEVTNVCNKKETEETVLLNSEQQLAVHRFMGENSPQWSLRWHILLSVINSGKWKKYQL